MFDLDGWERATVFNDMQRAINRGQPVAAFSTGDETVAIVRLKPIDRCVPTVQAALLAERPEARQRALVTLVAGAREYAAWHGVNAS